MKRINPTTGKPFKRGDIGLNGKIFWQRRLKSKLQNGFFAETWYTPERYEQVYRDNLKRLTLFAKQNPEIVNKRARKWAALNRDKKNQNWQRYRASKTQRTPKWLAKKHFAEIEEFYTIAKMFQIYTGESYHVDHVVPLKGKNVSGLHVPWNLTVIPAKENCRKFNKYDS